MLSVMCVLNVFVARQARSRAVSAAARAASSALPAQRERAVNEAAAAVSLAPASLAPMTHTY